MQSALAECRRPETRCLHRLLGNVAAKPNKFQAHASSSLKLIERLESKAANCAKRSSVERCERSAAGPPCNSLTDMRFVRGITIDIATPATQEQDLSPASSQGNNSRDVLSRRRAFSDKSQIEELIREKIGKLQTELGLRICDAESEGDTTEGSTSSSAASSWTRPSHSETTAEDVSIQQELLDVPRTEATRPPTMTRERCRDRLTTGSSPEMWEEPGFACQWPQEVLALVELIGASAPRIRHHCLDNERHKGEMRTNFRLHGAGYGVPHPQKAGGGGADAFFISGDALGVADGVGEWQWRFGINARMFADELMAGCESASTAPDTAEAMPAERHALRILQQGYRATRSIGSSTALVIHLDRQLGQLGVANLGDSALMVLRRKEVDSCNSFRVVARTKEQQHAFNCPYQLCFLPSEESFPELRLQGKEKLVRAMQKMPTSKMNTPEDADLRSIEVHSGDLLILGTDGVFDNLYQSEICQLLGKAVSPSDAASGKYEVTDPAKLAEMIVKAAFFRSLDRNARTPFSDNAQQAGLLHTGGKMDDITCVCAWVV